MVMFNAAQVMNEHNDEPYDKEFTKKQTAEFDRFYDVIGYDRRPLVETIDTMAKNRHVVESAHPVLSFSLRGAGPPADPGHNKTADGNPVVLAHAQPLG